ncbi:hypothetical protein LCI18_004784 [Fusarium solani-melongenae]|uniref:Uncharacterized protein n=1 Tax=Fusarium solani subsp. cucurbitae TaxID=2747967 RepID=A0ACD3YXZ2_FUSSC|nr:hypothetical protein LCI18_004784 [Fusarium solani-melongenae]
MATRKKLSSSTLYAIAWVAALFIERAAATAFLTERHDEPDCFNQHATGVYGTTSAAITASHLLSSLPHIMIGLLVGIGGGIPRPGRDIRLGDIVVSQPDGSNGGVVQYDLGKAKADQTWERKGALNMPPAVLLSALGKLQANHEMKDSNITSLLKNTLGKYPRMTKNHGHQGEENDRLFSPQYDHTGDSTCDACDSSREVKRPDREATNPQIHYGTVASGNTLVKQAGVRNSILQLVGEEFLCVEMEAAGLMNSFPCLVIRRICDYADSHKNDRWQRYASATASAFAVELLGCVPARQLQDTSSALEPMKSIAKVDHKMTNLRESIDSSYSKIVLDRVPTLLGAAHDSSDSWLQATCLESTRVNVLHEIHEWAEDPDSPKMFWLNGMAGTGKSTIARTVVQRLAEAGTLGGSFFFKKGETDRGSPSKLFTTLAASLSRWQPPVSRHIEHAINRNPQIFDQMPHQQFSKLILEPLYDAILRTPKPIVIVIDALDECQHHSVTSIITDIFPRARSLPHPGLKFFLTSRPELPILAGFPSLGRKSSYQDMILHNVSCDVIKKDLETYLSTTVERIRDRYNDGLSRFPQNWPGPEAIKRLVSMAIPLFIVASTVCRFLDDRRLGNPKREMDKILAVQDRAHASMLDQMYLAVLNQQFGDDHSYTPQQKSQIIDEFRFIVGSIVLLLTPLTIPALARLFHDKKGVEEFQETVEDRLEHLHSVLSVPPTTERPHSPVRVLHLSFRDFLVDHTRQDVNPFWVDEAESHRVLAHRCLRTLNASLRENICQLKHPGVLQTNIDPETVNRSLPPHVQYACLHWIDHMEQTHVDSATGDYIIDFLEIHLLHWLEALSLIGKVFESVEMMERLSRVTQNTGCSRLSKFLDDSIRFTGAHARDVALAPLQVYSSALIFVPWNSVVRTTFHAQTPNWISVQPGVKDEWSHCLQRLKSSGRVSQIALSQDSKLLAATIWDSHVSIWDVKTGAELLPLTRGGMLVFGVTFSADSSLACIRAQKHILVFKVLTGECIQRLHHDQNQICCTCVLTPDLIASGSMAGEIRIWKLGTSRLVAKLEADQNTVTTLATSADQRLLAAGTDDGRIMIWQTGSWTHLLTLWASGCGIRQLTFSSDSALIASVSGPVLITAGPLYITHGETRTVTIFEVESGQKLQELSIHNSSPDLMFRSESVMAVSRPNSLAISIWETKTGELLHELRDKRNPERLFTKLSSDSTLAISVLGRLDGIGDTVEAVEMSADNTLIAFGTKSGNIDVWQVRLDKDKCLGTSEGDPGSIKAVSPDLSLTASYHAATFTLTVRETAAGRCLHRFNSGRSPNSVVFSPNSKRVLSMGDQVLTWDIETGAELLALENPSQETFYRAAFSPTSELIAMAHPKGIQVWHISTGKCIQTIENCFQRDSTCLAFSSDSACIVAANDEGVQAWAVMTQQSLFTLRIGGWRNVSIALSTDKKLIALASDGQMVRVWQVSTGDCLGAFQVGSNSYRLSCEADDTQILTSDGLIGFNAACLRAHQVEDPPQDGEIRIGIGTIIERQWVTWHGSRLLLIPLEYKNVPATVHGSSVRLCSRSGRPIVITFNLHNLNHMYLDCV